MKPQVLSNKKGLPTNRAVGLLWLLVLFALSACSLAGDVTPPPDALAPEPPLSTPQPVQTSLPFVAADPEEGGLIYMEKCAPCHGARGMGDGEQAGKLPSPPPSIGSRTAILDASPTEWYALVTNGNLEKFMPGFAASLDDRQRWDVVAYLYTFLLDAEHLALGQEVYGQYCLNCHGERGAGDGPQAASLSQRLADWTDPALLAQRSASQLYQIVVVGDPPAMPAFNTLLTEEQRWAVVDYLRTFWFASFRPVEVEQLTQPVPTSSQALQPTATLQAETGMPAIETSSDISGLVAERVHLIFEFPQPDILQVAELYIITNPENKMIVPEAADKPLIVFDLPDGFSNLQFQEGVLGERYLLREGGFGDTQPIAPQDVLQEVFAFDLPYKRSQLIEMTLPVAVDQVIVMLPSGGVTLESTQLTSAGQRSIQGSNLSLYMGGGFQAGETLSIELSGRPQAAGAALTNANSMNLAVGIGVFGLVLLGVGFWFYRSQPGLAARRTQPPEQRDSRESLLDAILALDDLYREGKLSKEAYAQRRAELKARLSALVKEP